jgi:serine/threonine protein kinase
MHPQDPRPSQTLPSPAGVPAVTVEDRAESMRQLQPGDVLGRYRIRECIGEGGVGVVYSADDPELDRVVAIKVLRPAEERRTEAQQRRMLREAQALARVSHRNLVMVFDVGIHQGRIWIAMEYVVGDTLDQWLEKERRTWGEIVDTFISAGRGLAAVHAAGLVHRDFKPGNVLVRKDGAVQVLDFGLAARVGEQIEPAEHEPRTPLALPARDALVATMTKSVLGTPAYMAPEQFLLQPTDGRTDQFGFCVALYEALYGLRPFQGEEVPDLMHAIVAGLPGLPGELPGLPLAVRRALHRGLSTKKEDRFASMDELLDELAATRTPTERKSSGWMRFALGMLVGGGVLAGVGVWMAQNDDAPAPAAVAPVEPAPPEPALPQPPVQAPRAATPTRELPSLAEPDAPVAADEPTPAQPTPSEPAPRARERDGGALPKMPTAPKSDTPTSPKRLPSLSEIDENEQPAVDAPPREPTPPPEPPDRKPDEPPAEPTPEPAEDPA